MGELRHRRWLVLSYFTGVDALACSHHVDDRLQSLRDLGVNPVVVTSLASPPSSGFPCSRAPSVAPSGIQFESRYWLRRRFGDSAMRKIVRTGLVVALSPGYLVESAALGFDCTWSWYHLAARAAARLGRRHNATLIYSTGGPSSAHRAAFIAARKLNLPWIAEFQDPLVGTWSTRRPLEQAANGALEKMVAGNADAVVCVTRTALEEASERQPIGAKGHFIYPGADPPSVVQGDKRSDGSGKLVIGHFGSLGESRNTRALQHALKRLVAIHPEAKEQIRIWLVGSRDRDQQELVGQFAYPEMIAVQQKLSRSEALERMQECDALALIQNDSSASAVTIPSKTYEYLHTGIPILALTCGNPELTGMLVERGHYGADLRHPDDVLHTLERLYLTWTRDGLLARSSDRSPYTTHAAAARLLEIGDEIVARRASRGLQEGEIGEGSHGTL